MRIRRSGRRRLRPELEPATTRSRVTRSATLPPLLYSVCAALNTSRWQEIVQYTLTLPHHHHLNPLPNPPLPNLTSQLSFSFFSFLFFSDCQSHHCGSFNHIACIRYPSITILSITHSQQWFSTSYIIYTNILVHSINTNFLPSFLTCPKQIIP